MNLEELCFEIDPDEKSKHDLCHKGRFHLPSALSEMELLRPDAVIEEGNRKVVCWVQNPTPQQDLLCFFPDTHRSYDPLAYPLFFPYGTDGWHLCLYSNNNEYKRTITLSQYVRYHIMTRYNRNLLHDGRKLYQQWIIDQYAKVESNCLQYILLNQNNLR